MRTFTGLMGLFWLSLSLTLTADENEALKINPHHIPAATCGGCHPKIYEQWSTSMHAKSTPLTNSVFAHLYQKSAGDPLQEGVTIDGEYPVCLQCHAPNAAKDGNTKLDEFNYKEGVNCVVCHTLREYKGHADQQTGNNVGLSAYKRSENYLQAPSGRYLSPVQDAAHPFPMEPNQALLRTNRVCLGCHTRYDQVEMCQIGMEVPERSVTCQSCHMPKTDGLANHAVLSAHNDAVLTRSVVVTLDVQHKTDSLALTVHLENMLPHPFPGGVPYRNALVKVTAYSEKDELLWSNFTSYPPDEKDDPDAVLKYTVKQNKEAPLVPFKKSAVLKDNRLQAFEKRQLSYQLPKKDVYIVRAEVLFNLLTLSLIEELGDSIEGDIRNPVVAAIAEMRL